MSSPIHKLGAVTAGGTLQLSVTKSGGPVITRAVVGSTGNDDTAFDDSQLTPGPASMPLDANNAYSIVWTGGFVADGTALLAVLADHGQGQQPTSISVPVTGKAGDVFFRVVLIP